MAKSSRLILLFLLISFGNSFAQKHEISFNAGFSGYVGDLNPYKVYPLLNPEISGGASYSYRLKPHLALRGNLNYVKIAGSDETSGVQENLGRGLSFTNNIFESSLVADLEFFTFYSDRTRFRYTPYIFGGIGAMFNDAKSADFQSNTGSNADELNIDEIEMINLGKIKNISTKQTSQYNFILPVGVGFKVNLAGPFSVGIQLNYRFPLGNGRDRLDLDILKSENFVSKPELDRGQVKFDTYLTTVFTVGYSIYKFRDYTWDSLGR